MRPTMATQSSSPGQALLRASRVFAIPQPLKGAATGYNSVFSSNTATLPHPTHLTITTPPSSLSRGDWGLKRSLPLRATTRTSTPIVRVKAMDTYEHITEFKSGSDHALNLIKFLEMEIPLTTPDLRKIEGRDGTVRDVVIKGRGVFEADVDLTTKTGKKEIDDHRWKFEGPWLAGQTEGEFQQYMLKTVRKRKTAFMAYLREARATELNKRARRLAADERSKSGVAEVAEGARPKKAPKMVKGSDITDIQLREYLRQLRDERSQLFTHITSFLDLPPPPRPGNDILDIYNDRDSEEKLEKSLSRGLTLDLPQASATTPYAANGPPKTHPSAGLSYLRTKNVMDNHPVFGPQASVKPITSRVIQPKNANTGPYGAKTGVAGFVADLPYQSFQSVGSRAPGKRFAAEIPNTLNFDVTTPGGAKVEVFPTKAIVDSAGHIVLSTELATETAVAARDGNMAFFEAPVRRRQESGARKPFNYKPNQGRMNRGYGLGDEVGGFDPLGIRQERQRSRSEERER